MSVELVEIEYLGGGMLLTVDITPRGSSYILEGHLAGSSMGPGDNEAINRQFRDRLRSYYSVTEHYYLGDPGFRMVHDLANFTTILDALQWAFEATAPNSASETLRLYLADRSRPTRRAIFQLDYGNNQWSYFSSGLTEAVRAAFLATGHCVAAELIYFAEIDGAMGVTLTLQPQSDLKIAVYTLVEAHQRLTD